MELSWVAVMDFITLYGVKLIASLLIFFVGKKVAHILTTLVVKGMRKSNIDETITRFSYNVIYGGLLVIIVLAALSNLGINTASFIAVLGAAGLAVGLALQGTLSNVGAGILLVLFRPFRIGHTVQIAGENGTVEEINLFSVVLKSPDNKQIVIPNSAVISRTIINFSAKEIRRSDLVFTIGYSADLLLAKETLFSVIARLERVLAEPAPLVAVSELAPSGVRLLVRVWVKNEDFASVNFELIEQVKLAFDAKGIGFVQLPLTSESV
jgi:small conductance mechanosensitive channel